MIAPGTRGRTTIPVREYGYHSTSIFPQWAQAFHFVSTGSLHEGQCGLSFSPHEGQKAWDEIVLAPQPGQGCGSGCRESM